MMNGSEISCMVVSLVLLSSHVNAMDKSDPVQVERLRNVAQRSLADPDHSVRSYLWHNVTESNPDAMLHFKRGCILQDIYAPSDNGILSVMSRHDIEENLDKALAEFQQAIQSSPQFAEAHARLAQVYYDKFYLHVENPRPASIPEAKLLGEMRKRGGKNSPEYSIQAEQLLGPTLNEALTSMEIRSEPRTIELLENTLHWAKSWQTKLPSALLDRCKAQIAAEKDAATRRQVDADIRVLESYESK